MADTKLLLIVGAGAGYDINMPLGDKLKNDIIALIDIELDSMGRLACGDRLIYRVIENESKINYPSRLKSYLNACQRIRTALPQEPSIDNCIDKHQGNKDIEFCGKIAIVRSILRAESTSKLAQIHRKGSEYADFSLIEDTWYNKFIHLLTENCNERELPPRLGSVALIIFNYDRCIEHYLYISLQNIYGMDAKKAAEYLNSMKIYHPYGTVGKLPWQTPSDSIAYGAEPDANQLLLLSRGIKTFTEGIDPGSSDIGSIRRQIREADKILFLGFAYWKQNLELMKLQGPPETINIRRKSGCFGTALKISDTECQLIGGELGSLFEGKADKIDISNRFDCKALFHEFRRTISLSYIDQGR